MSKLSFIFGILMIGLGVGGFFLSSASPSSVTALIPAFVGVILVLLAAIAKKSPSANMHAMHVAALLTLLAGIAGSVKGAPNVIAFFKGTPDTALKAITQGGFSVLCFLFLFLCIRSFIAARRARLANQ